MKNIPTEELARATLQLLTRVELKGSEVAAFVDVSNWLNGMAQSDLPPIQDLEAE